MAVSAHWLLQSISELNCQVAGVVPTLNLDWVLIWKDKDWEW